MREMPTGVSHGPETTAHLGHRLQCRLATSDLDGQPLRLFICWSEATSAPCAILEVGDEAGRVMMVRIDIVSRRDR
jgi:hypothetical protein